MLEIKFRFWNKIDKQFVKTNWWNGNWCLNEVFNKLSEYNLEAMQYTWYFDKRWIELCVWDIYHMWFEYWDWTHKYWDRNVCKDIRDIYICDEFTIIWNIYENPELIKNI